MDTFEVRLAGVLRADAERAVVPIDAAAIADAAVHGQTRRIRRRPWLLPAVAALLVAGSLIGGALLVGSGPDRQTSVVPPGPVDPAPLAIVLRRTSGPEGDVAVVGLTPSGPERLLRTLDSDEGLDRLTYSTFGHVSPRGDLAVSVAAGQDVRPGGYALLSLADPDLAPVVMDAGQIIGGRWSPTGRFGAMAPGAGVDWQIDVVDPGAETRRIGPLDLPGGGPEIVWAADGSGLLVRVEATGGHGIAPVDGGPVQSTIPHLSFSGAR
jgi:hypothetical protein